MLRPAGSLRAVSSFPPEEAAATSLDRSVQALNGVEIWGALSARAHTHTHTYTESERDEQRFIFLM